MELRTCSSAILMFSELEHLCCNETNLLVLLDCDVVSARNEYMASSWVVYPPNNEYKLLNSRYSALADYKHYN